LNGSYGNPDELKQQAAFHKEMKKNRENKEPGDTRRHFIKRLKGMFS